MKTSKILRSPAVLLGIAAMMCIPAVGEHETNTQTPSIQSGRYQASTDKASEPSAPIVEYHLKGKGESAWNDHDHPLEIPVGSILRIVNDDNQAHRMHTNGVPCKHSPVIPVGGHYDCGPLNEVFDQDKYELYEHNYGPSAHFYIKTVKVVEYHLKGKGNKAWNDRQHPAEVPVGYTLRIVNDDNQVHQLHTFGEPCEHSDEIPVGGHYDCGPVKEVFGADKYKLYDHLVGPSAPFYIEGVKDTKTQSSSYASPFGN